jgi:hypothetical protein
MHTLTAPTNPTSISLPTALWSWTRTNFGDRCVHRFWPRGTELSRPGAACVVETTPLDAAPIWDAFIITVTDHEDAAPSLRLAALAACDDLRNLLGVSDTRLAEIVGISRNSIGNWRKSSHEPYPATVRNLLSAHAMVSAYGRRHGTDRAALWVNEHIERFSTDEGLESLAAELRRHLLPQRPSMLSDIDDETTSDSDANHRSEITGELLTDDATFV